MQAPTQEGMAALDKMLSLNVAGGHLWSSVEILK